MTKGAWRYSAFANNGAAVQKFCLDYGFEMESLNNGYQLRIEGVIDVYPVRKKWHWLATGERGEWSDVEELRKVMLDRLPIPEAEVPFVEPHLLQKMPDYQVKVEDGELTYPKTDGFKTIGTEPLEVNRLEDEVPIEMFYKKPKWWQWRKRRAYRKLLTTNNNS